MKINHQFIKMIKFYCFVIIKLCCVGIKNYWIFVIDRLKFKYFPAEIYLFSLWFLSRQKLKSQTTVVFRKFSVQREKKIRFYLLKKFVT